MCVCVYICKCVSINPLCLFRYRPSRTRNGHPACEPTAGDGGVGGGALFLWGRARSGGDGSGRREERVRDYVSISLWNYYLGSRVRHVWLGHCSSGAVLGVAVIEGVAVKKGYVTPSLLLL